MRYILFIFICFNGLIDATGVEHPNFFKGVNSFTVYNQISPHALDLAFESSLEQALGKMGKVLTLRAHQSFEENFYSAISNSTFLKLSLENSIVEITGVAKKKFKVEMHLVLECFKRDSKKDTQNDSPVAVWIAEEVFDFSPDGQALMNLGKQAVSNLAKKFLEDFQKENPEINNDLTFYVL
jgi:hypothetical protein